MENLTSALPLDALSQVLADIRFRGTLYCRSELGSPWGFRVQGRDAASFHLVERGACVLEVEGLAGRLSLSAGDLVFLPHGHAHTMKDSPESDAILLDELVRAHGLDEQRRLRAGGDGPTTILLCGGFFFHDRATLPLLGALPPVIHVAASPGTTTWLKLAHELITSEVHGGRSGASAVIDRLSDLLFIEAIRSYFDDGDDSRRWAAAFRDPSIGAALMAIHRSLAKPWTVESLALEASMSRSAFATRFSVLLGESPLRYVTRCRMNAAVRLLSTGSLSVAEIAERVGYDSDVAFGRAFRRHVGMAPSMWRRSFESGTVSPGDGSGSAVQRTLPARGKSD
jgi:AraC-like DNA-binding protein